MIAAAVVTVGAIPSTPDCQAAAGIRYVVAQSHHRGTNGVQLLVLRHIHTELSRNNWVGQTQEIKLGADITIYIRLYTNQNCYDNNNRPKSTRNLHHYFTTEKKSVTSEASLWGSVG